MKAKRKPTKTTRGERLAAKAEIDMLTNPQSGDPEFEAYQEERKKKFRPVREALKKVHLGWNTYATTGGKSGKAKSDDWIEKADKIEKTQKSDSPATKVAKSIARATPIPQIVTALNSGLLPVFTHPAIKGGSELIEAISSEMKKRRTFKQDIKAIARGNKPNATDYEKSRSELLRLNYEKRGINREESDKQRYYGKTDPTTYSFGFGGKFKKK
jgi:hypothetical protein